MKIKKIEIGVLLLNFLLFIGLLVGSFVMLGYLFALAGNVLYLLLPPVLIVWGLWIMKKYWSYQKGIWKIFSCFPMLNLLILLLFILLLLL